LRGLAAWGVGDRIRTRRPGKEETQAIAKGKHGRSAEMGEPGLAYCGVNCRECPVFTATVNDDDELRLKTGKEWGELYSVAPHLIVVTDTTEPRVLWWHLKAVLAVLVAAKVEEAPEKRATRERTTDGP